MSLLRPPQGREMAREFPLVWDRILECANFRQTPVCGQRRNDIGANVGARNARPRRYMRYEDKVGYQFMSDQARVHRSVLATFSFTMIFPCGDSAKKSTEFKELNVYKLRIQSNTI